MAKDPLHGITLEKLLTELVEQYGFEQLGEQVRVNCFLFDPSINSSLKFLRRVPWARKKVEDLYLWHLDQLEKERLEREAAGIAETPAPEPETLKEPANATSAGASEPERKED